MTKTQLKHIKELDAFLKERKMELRGDNIIVGFNMHKYKGTGNIIEEHVCLNIDIGFIRGGNANIAELNERPTIKEHYYIDKNGKVKSLY